MFVPSFWTNLWMDFFETWHDNMFSPNLKHGRKNLENGYYGNKKKPKMILCPEKPQELQT